MTELCEIGFKYKTDKCPQIKHHFTEFYHEMFKDHRNDIKKVVEIGIGNMHPYFVMGASLYMWREYFPNAQIYGADIEPSLIFQANRIRTILCDQTKKEDLKHLVSITGSDVDIFIDDGTHEPSSQVFTCLTTMPLLNNPIYVIEDVGFRSKVLPYLGDYDYNVLRYSHRKYNDDCLVVIKKK